MCLLGVRCSYSGLILFFLPHNGSAKFAALEDAGVYISRSPAQLGSTMVRAFEERGMAM